MWIFAPIMWIRFFLPWSQTQTLMLGLTVSLLRTMLPTVIIFGVSGLVMGTLNAHQVFLWPALAPAMYSFGQIFGILVLPKSMGIQRLAVGAVIGALGHLALQLPSLFRLPDRFYEKAAGIKDAAVRQVLIDDPRIIGAVWFSSILLPILLSSFVGRGGCQRADWH